MALGLNLKGFAEFLGACADRHDGYIMGAVGQDPKTLHEWYFNQYKDRTQYSAKQEAQALQWKETAARVWDCQGLADGYVTELLGQRINVRARNNYATWCGVKGEGKIPNGRKVPGAAVFMDNGSYVHHVGFLEKPIDADRPEGDWWVVEAQGVLYGVVRTKLNSRRWNKWGWMTKYFDYSDHEATDGSDKAQEYGWRTLKKGAVGDDVKALQVDLIALNYSCGKYGADGEFGKMTESALMAFQKDHALEPDGVAGAKTYAKLNELLMESGVEELPMTEARIVKISAGKSWNIRTQPSIKGAVLGYAKHGESFPAGGQSAEGWASILFNGEQAWISEKAVGE